MAGEQNKTREGWQGCCGGMPMRKMLEAKKSGQPFNCAEMMSQMMKMWAGAPKKERESAPDSP
jgi:hypothetical protein